MTGLSLEEQIYAELVIVRKFSLVYLIGTGIGTKISRGPAELDERLSCLEPSSLSGLLYRAERDGFLRGQGTISAELSNCRAEFGIV